MDDLEIRREGETFAERAASVSIETAQQYEAACELFLAIKAFKKKFKEWWEPIRKNAQDILERGREISRAADRAEEIIEVKMVAWKTDQDRREKELLLKMQRESVALQEEERLNDAALAESLGEKQLAEAILDTPVQPAPVVPPKLTPRVQGVSYRDYWSAEVVDKRKFIEFAISDPNYFSLIEVNQGGLDRIAASLKNNLNLPGVAVKCEKRVTGRARSGN